MGYGQAGSDNDGGNVAKVPVVGQRVAGGIAAAGGAERKR